MSEFSVDLKGGSNWRQACGITFARCSSLEPFDNALNMLSSTWDDIIAKICLILVP